MKKAFTLIELLIVVAIIAILAAIAVPNFLEAQTRAKVSRCRADLRSAATALEAYAVDWNGYPYDGYFTGSGARVPGFNYWYLGKMLSTPQAYITSNQMIDPFRAQVTPTPEPGNWQVNEVRYTNIDSTWGSRWDAFSGSPVADSIYLRHLTAEYGGWRMIAAGPDRTYGPPGGTNTSSWEGPAERLGYPVGNIPVPYDPTNGSISTGDVIRSQSFTDGVSR
jgi:prepilin-type N-terminal cleavage/methylation domain-containing protein